MGLSPDLVVIIESMYLALRPAVEDRELRVYPYEMTARAVKLPTNEAVGFLARALNALRG